MSKATQVATAAIILALVGGGFIHFIKSADEGTDSGPAGLDSYQSAIDGIATGIERLKGQYPQLAEFSSREHCDRDRLIISYGYRTHEAPHTGGWTSGVPNPDEDGVWFYIDLHHPDSQAQIHTQPVVPRYRFEAKEVMFLMLEGERTESIRGAILEIFRDNGVTAVGFGSGVLVQRIHLAALCP
jgi:hypothetical protein